MIEESYSIFRCDAIRTTIGAAYALFFLQKPFPENIETQQARSSSICESVRCALAIVCSANLKQSNRNRSRRRLFNSRAVLYHLASTVLFWFPKHQRRPLQPTISLNFMVVIVLVVFFITLLFVLRHGKISFSSDKIWNVLFNKQKHICL